jgi:hypothetical protein
MAGMKKVLEGFGPKQQNMDWSDAAADFFLTADRPPDYACVSVIIVCSARWLKEYIR